MTLLPRNSNDPEIDSKLNSGKRSFFTTEPVDDCAFRGFRVSFTKTINADGGVVPGFVLVSGLTNQCMPTSDGDDIQYLPLETLSSAGKDGLIVFVRKNETAPDTEAANVGNESENNISEEEEDGEFFHKNLQVKIAKLLCFRLCHTTFIGHKVYYSKKEIVLRNILYKIQKIHLKLL